MALTVLAVQKAKPKEKAYKLGDSGGLYLYVTPAGGKVWRHKYYFAGQERLLCIGPYPEITLAEARAHRDEARKLKVRGIDPNEVKREKKQELITQQEHSFKSIALEWHEQKKNRWSPYYAKQIMQRLELDIFPRIGTRPINKITAPDLFKVAKAIEARNALEIAHRAMQVCGQIFQYAIITGRALENPAAMLRGALKTPKKEHYACLQGSELPEFMKSLRDYDGSDQTKYAIELLLLTFVRTGELCGAKWSEIDLANAEWRIPAERMKMRTPHIVPLSKRAVEILTILKRLAGKWEHVLPSIYSPRKHMSTNTMLFAIYTMGWKGRTTIHGFRATASTVLNESGLFHSDAIERQLAHEERNRIRSAYNNATHLPLRREMMQWWADYLHEADKGQTIKRA